MTSAGITSFVHRLAMGPGQGYAPENVLHTGPGPIRKGIWTGFNWSAGGALAASAYLERTFGSAWVDGAARQVVAIDGVSASVKAWFEDRIELAVTSAWETLPHPARAARTILVKFGRLPPGEYTLKINDSEFPDLSVEKLSVGVKVTLPEQK